MSEKSLKKMLQNFATERPIDIDNSLNIMREHCKISKPKGVTILNELSSISTIPEMLKETDAIIFKSYLSKDEIDNMLNQIDNNQELLINYGEHYKVLGRVWSSDYVMESDDIYWEDAQASRERFRTVLPNIEEKLLLLCKKHIFKDENVIIREGFAGPAVVLFSPDKNITSYGGDIHIDWEGLEIEHLKNGVPAYSFVCMLSLPEENGGTGVWNAEFVYNHTLNKDIKPQKTIVDYELGDFAMFPSFKLHNIEAIIGTTKRVTLIFHVAYLDGYWQIWF